MFIKNWTVFVLTKGWRTRAVVINVLVCDILISEFEFQLRHYVQFQNNTFEKGMNSKLPVE